MTEPFIRPATPADVPAILSLIRELARFEHAEDQVKASEADLLRDGFGDRPAFEALVAEREGAVVGFALCFPNYSTWEGRAGLYLEDLYVRETERQSGLGRQLLAAVAARCLERGGGRVDLQVLDWNPARRFYSKIGLSQQTEWLPYRLTRQALLKLASEATKEGTQTTGR